MLQHIIARKKSKALLRSPTKKKATGSCRRLLRGAALQRSSELFVELRCSAAPSCSWSCAAARLRAVRGAALQCGSELSVELSVTLSIATQLRALQRRAVRGAAQLRALRGAAPSSSWSCSELQALHGREEKNMKKK